MFHVCTIGQKDEIMDIKFLCLNGTVFDQETRVCERVDEVDCSKSERFYNLNLELYGNNAVTLSLHEGEDENEETPVVIEDHQGSIHYSSTSNSQVSINGNDASSIFHPTSSTIQTLLNVNGNANNPSLINPIFHNSGISSSTEHYNNARETVDYQTDTNNNDQDDDEDDGDASRDENQDRRYLEPIQASNQGKVSKLTTSSGISSHEGTKSKITQSQLLQHQQHSRIPTGFLTIAQMNSGGAPRPFFPPPKPTGKTTHQSQTSHVTQHIHIPPVPPIPQLKPHQVTINLPPPLPQRIVSQNPSPLLPSQSRVIVTAKASVSDESGRPLNSTQLVTLPLPTIPASYDDYKEGDESFDPFYRDVPKIRNTRRSYAWEAMENFRRFKRSTDDVKVGTPMSYDEEYADVSENNDTKPVEADNKDYLNDDDDDDYNFEGSYEVEGEKEEVDGREEFPVAEKQVDLLVKVEKKNISEVDGDEFNIDKNLTTLSNLNLNMNNESDDSKVEEKAEEEEGEEEDYISSEEYSQVPATEYDLLIDEQDDELSNITELIVTEMINNSTEITITTDYPTTVQPYDSSEVKNNEDSEKKTDGDEDGVLKFTDEIPLSGNADYDKEDEDKVEQVIESVPVSSMPMDYVDDNYEPQHYQDQKISLSANVTTEDDDDDDDDGRVKAEDENNSTATDDNFKAEVESSTGIFISFTTPDTTSVSTMSSTTSTTPGTTSPSSTTTTTPTTTTTTSTTTSKPPKTLFKPITTRKNYNYIPPTTTPAPVVIKTRLPLLNPKPAKPPKSYNEIAPKPVIRKVPLVAKRFTTMRNIEVESTTNSIDFNNNPPEDIEANLTSYSSSTSTTTETPTTVASTATESSEKSTEMFADAAITSSSEETKLEEIPTTTMAPEVGKKYFTVRKPIDVFNCLNVELYRFYADKRDCRLFHYCSPGFTSRQVLDFRFVCEEGTVFDEISQSCVYQMEDSKCRKKVW
ncbi:hypothetical protein G9C98_000522 [Cotesia typhae]|uniref:Chitin-binding type-2 domain-containing protein n=1 Tax=Cotesia typhae TaxID=2053667 RepID=A0A8J5QSE0_9HYME|nr:hypothetical protein G9C98_000522 [Cotesia typhae]